MSERSGNICGATARSTGGPCRRPAGWGTDHVGDGRCKLHGGATPIKSGRYSSVRRNGFQELFDRHKSDPNPLDVTEELAAARTLLEDYIDRYDEMRDALLEWNRLESQEARKAKRKPRFVRVPDIADVIHSLEKITRIAQRDKRLLVRDAVTKPNLIKYFEEMKKVIERHTDRETARKMYDDFLEIKIKL